MCPVGSGPVGVVVLAAGAGSRLGGGQPKAFMLVAGRSLLAWAVGNAGACPLVGLVVVVAPSSHLDQARAAATTAAPVGVEVRVVAGGAHRAGSVAAGLAALPPVIDVVLVHDAARALAPTSLFAVVAEALRAGHPAVVPGLPVVDTIKQVDGSGAVVTTPDRSALRAVQTPQGFRRELLVQAHAAAVDGATATDDAALVERLGVPVLVVPGDPLARKITTPEDLAYARSLTSGRAS